MFERNRSEGWVHAKRSGHENVDLIKEYLESDRYVLPQMLKIADKDNGVIVSINHIGGLEEKNVESIIGRSTKSKTDLCLELEDGSKVNISVKKSLGGQVYLIGTSRFVEGFEKHFNLQIPDSVKRGIELFWGSAPDVNEIISKINSKHQKYETRKNRLVADTLYSYDRNIYNGLLEWFAQNNNLITEFCFARGLAKCSEDWAHLIWYINLIGENEVNDFFRLSDLYRKEVGQIEYGSRGGGTTIQLPFGFVQWHQNKMQFHHNYHKIIEMLGSC